MATTCSPCWNAWQRPELAGQHTHFPNIYTCAAAAAAEVYTKMMREGGGGNILARVFFPPADAAAQALAVWGVFAVGFVCRPLGALLFGHFGDTRGRGITLLLSVLGMGVPTVLIGCLPTYKEIGIAAPLLLIALRAAQGIAMGGEFGAALVYLYEAAPQHRKGLLSCLGCVFLGLGVGLGTLAVAAVTHFMPPASLVTLGWRIPFLASSVTLVAAIIVRFNMPESTEFAIRHDEIEQEFHRRLQQQLQLKKQEEQQQQQQQQQQRQVPGNSRAGRYSCTLTPIPSCSDLSCSARHGSSGDVVTNAVSDKSDMGSTDLEALRQLLLAERHYVPVVELFRSHWRALLLQCGYEAWIGAALHLGINWLPGYFMRQAGLPQHLALWMVLSSVALFAAAVLAAGAASDRGVGRLRATTAVCGTAVAWSIPSFIALSTSSLAACWLVQAATLTLAGCAAGMLPAICCSLYPPGVRLTGVCLGFHLGMLAFGVLTPVALSAIKTAGGPLLLAPGAWMTAMAALSLACSAALARLYPDAGAA
ncbi:major facilitator superfamily domain-containing protein [Scenedesmus sp. NREL 46B-D3]|nr:major facilitator superfamily domain-containing protein [Scenedesmus sp. NREL 46B-D3]